MAAKIPPLGILQGRLTLSTDGSIQFFPKDNWQSEFEAAHNIGFDCIELLIKPDSYEQNPLWSEHGIKTLAYLVEKNNLAIHSVHAFYGKGCHYPEVLRRIVSASAHFGVRTVLVSFFNQNALKIPSTRRNVG